MTKYTFFMSSYKYRNLATCFRLRNRAIQTAQFISDSILNPSGWKLFAGGFASLIDHLILLFIAAGEDTAKQRKHVESNKD
jgi:hypothetical protein